MAVRTLPRHPKIKSVLKYSWYTLCCPAEFKVVAEFRIALISLLRGAGDGHEDGWPHRGDGSGHSYYCALSARVPVGGHTEALQEDVSKP